MIRGFLVVLVVCASAQVWSFEVAQEVKDRLEPTLTKQGGRLDYFPGPDGMIGIGVSFRNGKQMVVYATEDGRTVFSGVAIDIASGTNIAARDQAQLPAVDMKPVFDSLEAAHTISEGNLDSENQFYVFFDPRCGFCHRTYQAFLTTLSEGHDLAVHYIPVGINGPESENLSKEILGSSEDEGRNLLRKHVMREGHSFQPQVASNGSAAFGTNTKLFRDMQLSGVPVIVSKVGKRYEVRMGAIPKADVVAKLSAGIAGTVGAE